MMEILPFLTSPMGCDLPMSLVLSCSPSLVLHILAMRPHVEKIVNDRLQPYIEAIEHTKTTVLAQETAHTTSDNFTTVSPSDGDVETVWLDITVSESDAT
jgi:flagellar biosynthesis protein FliP